MVLSSVERSNFLAVLFIQLLDLSCSLLRSFLIYQRKHLLMRIIRFLRSRHITVRSKLAEYRVVVIVR